MNSSAMDRRTFLTAAAVATTLAFPAERVMSAGLVPRGALIDVNVSLGHWPSRRLPCDESAALVTKLREERVAQGWAGSFEGLLHKDLGSVNARLAAECRQYRRRLLLAFGSVNPKAPDWEEELRRCAEEHRMAGIRLHPNYHGYKLDDPDFMRLLRVATERRLIVQLALAMEDERTMHTLLRVEPVNPAPLADVLKQIPGVKLVLLNALKVLRWDSLRKIIAAGEVYVEIAMLEGVGGLGSLVEQIPPQRILFGSHAPFFYFDSARLKLQESALTDEQLELIRYKNAQGLVASRF